MTTVAKALDGRLRSEARTIAGSMTRFKDLIAEAKANDIHDLLGFKSWPAYVADVVREEMGGLSVDDRRQVVALLTTEEGMSSRAAAKALGVSHPTVIRDRAALEAVQAEPERVDEELDRVVHDVPPGPSDTVTGRDGKSYPAHPQPRPDVPAPGAGAAINNHARDMLPVPGRDAGPPGRRPARSRATTSAASSSTGSRPAQRFSSPTPPTPPPPCTSS
jgi:hypothetical protein